MSNFPLISVIINCFNGGKFLKEAIESVIGQTYQNWEIIFWDDQSTDESANIVKSYADNRIHYFLSDSRTNLGMARKLALEKAKGEWIGFLDCDDSWNKDKLYNQIEILNNSRIERNKIGIIYGRTEYIDSGGNILQMGSPNQARILPEGQIFQKLILEDNFISMVSALYLKKALIKNTENIEAFSFSPDYFINCGIAKSYQVIALQKKCCKYRIHEGSMSSGEKRTKVLREDLEILKYRTENYQISNIKLQRKFQKLNTVIALHKIMEGQIFEGLSKFLKDGSFFF
ncbi:MAG: glycosyltransferase family 2 protein [Candidatus Riflebacteria bacterium]|nr:glycosyltransferase family 2 protein [Candidatus Riflebacteria bacterium]